MIGEKVAKVKETVKHVNIIVEDMKKNRSEYSSKDLSWRNVDLMAELVKVINDLSDLVMVLVEAEGIPLTSEEMGPEREKEVDKPQERSGVDTEGTQPEADDPNIGTEDAQSESEEGGDEEAGEEDENLEAPDPKKGPKGDKPKPSAPKVTKT